MSADFWFQNDSSSYSIGNSLRFPGNQNKYLEWTPGTNTVSGTKWTMSFWCKKQANTVWQSVIYGINNTYPECGWNDGNGGAHSEGFAFSTGTLPQILSVVTPKFQDLSKWYHVCWAWDTSQPVMENRSRYWINGVQIPISSMLYNGAQPGQGNSSNTMGGGALRRIGTQNNNVNSNFNGWLAEWHQTSGHTYDASYFGEFKNGIWVPKKVEGITYGAAGFYLNFSDTSNFGRDFSGNNIPWQSIGFVPSDASTDSPPSG